MRAVIVQARMNSRRLPGKVLLPLNGRTVIGEVLERCKRISADVVVCAIADDELSNEIVPFARAAKVAVFRGPEDDVLSRYYKIAKAIGAKTIMRITADCPLICPELCDEVFAKLDREEADYCSNVWPRTFPQGLDCEAFTMVALNDAYYMAKPDEREHVTTWMRRANIKRVNVESPWKIEGRLTLDTEDDYRVICAAFGHEPFQRLRAA
jgi:spore coat polysaccharide biosynthesis protein SpsF